MAKHREKSRQFTKEKADRNRGVNSIFDEYGIENCKIELLEHFPCENRDELLKREGYYIKKTECVNKIVPGRTNKEWQDDNKEQYRRRKKNTPRRTESI